MTVASAAPLALRLALRELRAGLGGFYVFIACMALGVAVITAVGALADALTAGFERQGEAILGGDVTMARIHARASREERAFLDARGRTSETATMRSMARAHDTQALIEIKAVDAAYPLAGTMQLDGGATLAAALAKPATAVVDRMLLARLGVGVGDSIRIGSTDVRIGGVIAREPDVIADRVIYGPRVMMSVATLEATGLVQPGSLIRWRYAVKLPATDPAALVAFRENVAAALPEAGFMLADRRDPSPQVTRTLERLRQFLSLIGLTALLIGGVGVANAVATFIDRRRKVIATMKSLGASGPLVLAILLGQVMLIAAIGIGIGLAIGGFTPVVLDRIYGDALPIRAAPTVSLRSIATAVGYGVLVALVFTLWPLGRAERIPAAALFRDDVAGHPMRPRSSIIVAIAVGVVAMAALAILGSDSRRIALYFAAAVAGSLVLFAGLGTLVSRLARFVPRRGPVELKLAQGSIGAPDGLTRAVVVSLGAGLSLMVAVALTDASLTAELTSRLPRSSPAYYALDIERGDRDAFIDTVRRAAPDAQIQEAPMLRGRIVRLNGVPVEKIQVASEARWVLEGDRGLTYSTLLPDGSRMVAGEWWPPDWSGEPLVSFEADLAKRLGLKLGDTVTVNVLGRNITARISSLREFHMESLAINFVMVFSPNTLAAAPHNLLATVTLPPATSLESEAGIARAIGTSLPSVTMIRVKDAIAAFEGVFAKVMTAVRVASGVTLAAGALVLAGALATAQRRRIKQAVILKALGATRGQVLGSHLIEYLLLAIATAALAVALGSVTAWVAVTRVMEFELTLSAPAILSALGVAVALVLAFGLAGTWLVLRAPTVPQLRGE